MYIFILKYNPGHIPNFQRAVFVFVLATTHKRIPGRRSFVENFRGLHNAIYIYIAGIVSYIRSLAWTVVVVGGGGKKMTVSGSPLTFDNILFVFAFAGGTYVGSRCKLDNKYICCTRPVVLLDFCLFLIFYRMWWHTFSYCCTRFLCITRITILR